MASSHRLDWVCGTTSIDLVSADGPAGSYWFEVLADEYEPGSAEAVREVATSLFLDGDFTVATRSGNVSKSFLVRVTGTDSVALADGEAVLDLMRGRRASEIRWDPPDGFGATSVRKVLVTDLAQQWDDLAEVRRNQRVFRVTMECLPHTFSVDPVVYTVGTGTTTVDDASALTNWTVVSGSAVASAGAITTTGATVIELTPPVDWDEYAYLDFTFPAPTTNLTITLDGVTIPYASRLALAGGDLEFPTGDARGTRAVLRLAFASGTYVLNDVSTRTFPDATIVSFDAVGTRRTPALVQLYRSAGALGDVFVYTAPDPARALADGVSFNVFGKVNVVEVLLHPGEGGFVEVAGTKKRFGAGDTWEDLGQTKPQAAFTGNTLWTPDTSTSTTGNVNTVTVSGTHAYPDDREARVCFVHGVTAKNIWFVPPTPEAPSGGVFTGDESDGSDAVAYTLAEGDIYEPLAVFPDRSGVIASATGAGAVATVTYTPAWAFNAGA